MENIGNKTGTICNCPFCNAEAFVTREDAENHNSKKCIYCGKVYTPFINSDTNTIEVSEYKQFGGETKAICNCPVCTAEAFVTREDAENHNSKKCIYCGNIYIPYINSNTNTIDTIKINDYINELHNLKEEYYEGKEKMINEEEMFYVSKGK